MLNHVMRHVSRLVASFNSEFLNDVNNDVTLTPASASGYVNCLTRLRNDFGIKLSLTEAYKVFDLILNAEDIGGQCTQQIEKSLEIIKSYENKWY